MKRGANIPLGEGAYALVHARTRVAYVGTSKKLRATANVLASQFKHRKPPIKNLPDHPAGEWSFVPAAGKTSEELRETLAAKGLSFVNAKSRIINKLYVVDGVERTVPDHCAHYGKRAVNWPTVYKRLGKGLPIRQALGLDPIPFLFDQREHRINRMTIKVTSAGGGWLTYDEAQLERPELGNIRVKVKKWAAEHPGITEVKLSDL